MFSTRFRGSRKGQRRKERQGGAAGFQPRLEELESRVLLTRSIVAGDPLTGEVGIVVVSWPTMVPGIVPVGEPGVIVANQSTPNINTAHAIIDGIKSGEDAPTALANAVAHDSTSAFRQLGVAALDPKSPTGVTVANYTGFAASAARCNVIGPTFSVQANLQTTADVCGAMADGFSSATGSLGQRLLAAVEAGIPVGGDRRGEYSASLRVYSNQWELASASPISADANVTRSATWAVDLRFGLDAYQATLTRGNPSDRVELTPKRAEAIQQVLHDLGYYQGKVTGQWSDQAERALVRFGQLNLHFVHRTTVDQGVRYIDGPLAEYLVNGLARGALRPAEEGPNAKFGFQARSIVAADPATGQFGIAAVSFAGGVAAALPVLGSQVGAGQQRVLVANLGIPSLTLAHAVTAGVENGADASTALANALADDPAAQFRQLGVVALSADSPPLVSVASYTGDTVPQGACGLTGENFAIQAGLQTSTDVCAAMADGFTQTTGSLARRLLAALLAGGDVGGDQRGEYSAVVQVFPAGGTYATWTPYRVDVAVDRSGGWAEDLQFGVAASLATFSAREDADLVELTPERARAIQNVLLALNYYQGEVSDDWSTEAENALRAFETAYLSFLRGTVVQDGTRFIDAQVVDFLLLGYQRGVFPPVPGAPTLPPDRPPNEFGPGLLSPAVLTIVRAGDATALPRIPSAQLSQTVPARLDAPSVDRLFATSDTKEIHPSVPFARQQVPLLSGEFLDIFPQDERQWPALI